MIPSRPETDMAVGRRGRPCKSALHRRSYWLTFRVTPDEADALYHDARAARMKLSEMIRSRLFRGSKNTDPTE